jgi:hypothetical protein
MSVGIVDQPERLHPTFLPLLSFQGVFELKYMRTTSTGNDGS